MSCDPAGEGRMSFARFVGHAAVSAAVKIEARNIAQEYAGIVRRVSVALLAAAGLLIGATAAAAPEPRFSATVSPVRWSDLRFSYRAGCPIGPAQLRRVQLSYWGFDRRVHVGALVVSRRLTGDIVTVFRRLHAARFPIRRMVSVSAYRGSDDASMAADNTSGFNCRRAAGSTSGSWSMHAYGEAIDINPVENPYVVGVRVLPPAGKPYADRTRYRRGMALPGNALVRAFEHVGWKWGGRWVGTPDYQHFSSNGH